jgi:endogenous inhibitor of DNA gyrase (YacG/DUF329 family)
MRHRCPTCKKYFKAASEKSKYFPFCSERCKLIDLGEWLEAGYKIITPASEDKSDKQADNDKR